MLNDRVALALAPIDLDRAASASNTKITALLRL